MSRSPSRRRRELVLEPAQDVVAAPGGFEVRGAAPRIVAAATEGPQPSGWVIVEHDAGAPFTLLFDQGRGVDRPGRSRIAAASDGRGFHLIGLSASSQPLRLALDANPGPFPLTSLVAHELGTWPLFIFLLRWRRREDGLGAAMGDLLKALRSVARGPGSVFIQSRLDRQYAIAPEPSPSLPAVAVSDPAALPRSDARERAAHRERTRSQLAAFLAAGPPLWFPPVAEPDVSVIVVVHDQADLTFTCLQSIAGLRGPATVEVLIYDNASTDQTPALLARVDGATVIRSGENVGFVGAVNELARQARGRALLLLNNDAEVHPGALAAAFATLHASDDTAAVGGRVVLLDGTLQEAGSIVWRDGSCSGYGRGEDPDAGPYRFRRDVDFCSGVFLMIRADCWRRLGGLDDAFAPAYYEEVDFCLRAKEAGWRVVYEPAAVVRHYESATAGDDRAVGLQLRNRSLLVSRHAALLESRLAPATASLLSARTANSDGRRILVLDDMVPHPFEGSGCPRLRALLGILLGQGLEVTFYPTQFPDEDWRVVNEAVPPQVEVLLRRGTAGLEELLVERRGFYRALLVSRPHNMKPVAAIRERRPALFDGMRLIYDAEALFAMRDQTWAELHGDRSAARRAERDLAAEVELARGADRVCAVSVREREQFARRGVDCVMVLPHAVVPAPTPAPFTSRCGFLFVGPLRNELTPNVDGLLWLLGAVLPRLRERLPGCEIVVVGRNENEVVELLKDDGVRFAGAVDDLRPFYDAARVFVAPTRFSAGVPLKILEAAAHGLPVVATDLLRDQLGWEAGKHLLSSPVSDPAAFADNCVRLASEEGLWRALRAAALERVRAECDPRAAEATLRRALDGVEGRAA